MQTSQLITAIRNRLTSDTGTGGLFAAGNALITGVFYMRAQTQAATAKYIVLTVANIAADDDFTNNSLIYQINVNIYVGQIDGQGLNESLIRDRVYARLHDWTPTLSGWTANGPLRFIDGGATELPDDESHAFILTFEQRQSQART